MALIAADAPLTQEAVKLLIVAPPLDEGALKLTAAAALPALADTPTGTPGTVTVMPLTDPSVLLEPPPQALIKSAAKVKVVLKICRRIVGPSFIIQ
jgi:hypothetical protein